MPLNLPKLEADLLKLVTDMRKRTDKPEQSDKDYAHGLAVIIDSYVRTGTVTTTGTAAAQTGTIG